MDQANRYREQLKKERDFWKSAAMWMANVHAANRIIAELSRTSKSERRRLASIMRKCDQWLSGQNVGRSAISSEDIRRRLQKNAESIEARLEPKK